MKIFMKTKLFCVSNISVNNLLIPIFDQNFDFLLKFRFFIQISIPIQIFDF